MSESPKTEAEWQFVKSAWPSFREAPPAGRVDEPLIPQRNGQGSPDGRIGALAAIQRHWPIVLATTVILVAAGIGLGLVRKPVYTAEGRLSVQVASPYPTSVPSAINASSGLASVYSRAIDAPEVIGPIAKQTSLTPRQVMARVAATQVPDTGVIRVSAADESESQTVLLTNLATSQLRRFVNTNLSGSSPQSTVVFRKYKRAAGLYLDRQERLSQAQNLYSSSPSASTKKALQRAEIQAQAAAVRRDGLARAYQGGQQLYSAPLLVTGRATSASSDRGSRLQLFALIGLIAGLGVGAVLATVQANTGSGRRPA